MFAIEMSFSAPQIWWLERVGVLRRGATDTLSYLTHRRVLSLCCDELIMWSIGPKALRLI